MKHFKIVISVLMLLPFGAGAWPAEPVLEAIWGSVPSVQKYPKVQKINEHEDRMPTVLVRPVMPVPVHELRMPVVQEMGLVPATAEDKLSLSDYSASSPYWSFTKGVKISEEKAGAWEDALMDSDEPNTAVIADTIDTSTLKIVCAGEIGLGDAERFTDTVAIQAYLSRQKVLGYNAVLFEWITGNVVTDEFVALVTWAAGEFDTIIVAPVPGGQADGRLPTRAKTTATLNLLLDQADVCLLGWGFTIDLVLYGDEDSNEFATRFFRWAERKAAAKGVPVWGNLFTHFHGTDQKYQYTPENHTAYVCANVTPRAGLFVGAEWINAKVAANGVPAGKPIILGPFI